MRDPTKSEQSVHTPRHIFSDEEFALYRQVFEATEQDFDQQDANEQISGSGRTTFHPADRPTQPHPIVKPHSSSEVQTKYPPFPGQSVLSACRTGIEAHQSMCRIDPKEIRISYKMYCILSGDVIEVHGDFNGKVSFVAISGQTTYIDVDVYRDTSIDIVICVH